MRREAQATLECEVCGAGWRAAGEQFDFTDERAPFNQLGIVFLADAPPVCPECGEADAWDTVE